MKTKSGDVLEIETPKGFSYVQYIGRHAVYGDVIRVFCGFYDQRPELTRVLSTGSGFTAFYSARASVSQGLSKVVGSRPLSAEVPRRLRRAGARDSTGKVLTWIVESNEQEIVRKDLSEEERHLPIAAVWDHGLLVTRIVEGWSPERES